MTISYVTAGAWGAGLGRPLAAAEVDGNFWDLHSRLGAMETAIPAAARGIESVTMTGSVLTVRATDGTVLYTGTLPTPAVAPRGPWPAVSYAAGDVAIYEGIAAMATRDHAPSPDWWADYMAGRWKVIAGSSAPSRTAVAAQRGRAVFEVPGGLAFVVGQSVVAYATDDSDARVQGVVESYAPDADGRYWLSVAVDHAVGGGVVAAQWHIAPGAGGSGNGGGWNRVEYPDAGHVVSESDAGALLWGDTSITMPPASTVPPGTAYAVTGFELSVSGVPTVGESVTVDSGEILRITSTGSQWAWSLERTQPVSAPRNIHGADHAFVFAAGPTLYQRQWYSPGWNDFFGMTMVEVVTPDAAPPHAVWRHIAGDGAVEIGEGLGVGTADPGAGAVDVSGGYRVGGAELDLRHLAAVSDTLTLAPGYGLRHDGTAMAATAMPLATDGDGIPYLPVYTVDALPTAAAHVGGLIRVADGDAGAACLAVSDGADWRRIALGAVVAGG